MFCIPSRQQQGQYLPYKYFIPGEKRPVSVCSKTLVLLISESSNIYEKSKGSFILPRGNIMEPSGLFHDQKSWTEIISSCLFMPSG